MRRSDCNSFWFPPDSSWPNSHLGYKVGAKQKNKNTVFKEFNFRLFFSSIPSFLLKREQWRCFEKFDLSAIHPPRSDAQRKRKEQGRKSLFFFLLLLHFVVCPPHLATVQEEKKSKSDARRRRTQQRTLISHPFFVKEKKKKRNNLTLPLGFF